MLACSLLPVHQKGGPVIQRRYHKEQRSKKFLQVKIREMPFLSKDWRDPGDQWVRYDGGWEKRKTLSTSEGPNSSSPHHHFATTIPAELRQQAHQHESQTTSGYKPAAKQDLVAVDRDGNFVNRHMQVSIFV